MPATLIILIGYLLGSISFAALLVKWRAGVDLRTVGSGNLGATNAGRVLGRRGAILVYALDFAKGVAPVLIWHQFGDGRLEVGFGAGIAAVIGHCFPIWHRLRGGKGVATASGVLLATTPLVGICTILTFAVVALGTRMISAGSVVAAIATPTAFIILEPDGSRAILATLILLAVLVIARHRANLVRIFQGQERRF